jgi:hypothetical protein
MQLSALRNRIDLGGFAPPPPTGKSEFPPLIPGQYNSRSFHLQISSTISSIDRDAPNPDI